MNANDGKPILYTNQMSEGHGRRVRRPAKALTDEDELRAIRLEGSHAQRDRKGIWSLHVTRNCHLTFRIDAEEGEVLDIHLEDYH